MPKLLDINFDPIMISPRSKADAEVDLDLGGAGAFDGPLESAVVDGAEIAEPVQLGLVVGSPPLPGGEGLGEVVGLIGEVRDVRVGSCPVVRGAVSGVLEPEALLSVEPAGDGTEVVELLAQQHRRPSRRR
jgi:hypothetical protein